MTMRHRRRMKRRALRPYTGHGDTSPRDVCDDVEEYTERLLRCARCDRQWWVEVGKIAECCGDTFEVEKE